jgi:hypothetical protein
VPLITEACRSGRDRRDGARPMGGAEKRLKELVSRALRVPRSQRGVPAEIMLGELGLMSFDARASMHTLRVWDAIMVRWPAALPRLAWLELVNACEALTGGPPMYSLVARVKEILQSVNRTAWFAVGLPRDDSTDRLRARVFPERADPWPRGRAMACGVCGKANAAIVRARPLVRAAVPGVPRAP